MLEAAVPETRELQEQSAHVTHNAFNLNGAPSICLWINAADASNR